MIIILKKEENEKELRADTFDHLKEQIVAHYFLDYIRKGKTKMEAYKLTGEKVGLTSSRVIQIIGETK